MNITGGLLTRRTISLALAAIALLLATALMAGGLSAQEAERGSIPGPDAEEYRRLAGTLRKETGHAGMTTSREADLENAGRQGLPAQAHGT